MGIGKGISLVPLLELVETEGEGGAAFNEVIEQLLPEYRMNVGKCPQTTDTIRNFVRGGSKSPRRPIFSPRHHSASQAQARPTKAPNQVQSPAHQRSRGTFDATEPRSPTYSCKPPSSGCSLLNSYDTFRELFHLAFARYQGRRAAGGDCHRLGNRHSLDESDDRHSCPL